MQRRTFLRGLATTAAGTTVLSRSASAADTQLEPGTWYDATVTDSVDGDTFDVKLDSDGTKYTIRCLGIDTAEASGYTHYDKVEEWEGIEDDSYLETWGNNASEFASGELPVDSSCQIAVDSESQEKDQYGRLLAKVRYDRTGDGSMDTVYNRYALAQGYARVYSASMSTTDEYWDLEARARTDRVNIWGESDPENTTEVRDNDIARTFHPNTSSVRLSSGAIPDSRVPLWAEPDATQSLESGGVDYSGGPIPLAGVDTTSRVGMLGGASIHETHDSYTDHLEHFVFVTNLVDFLSSDGREGMVLVDGGHHQFNGTHACSAEDTVYYQRYLEGQCIELAGVNDVDSSSGPQLADARAVVVTGPNEAFTSAEANALSSFTSNGGAVVLVGSAGSTSTRRSNLDALAADLGSDLRLNADSVTDDTSHVNDDSSLVTTTEFNTRDFSLWSAYSGSTQSYSVSIDEVQRVAGALNDEWVDITNTGDASIDMTDWTLENGDGDTFAFPDGFSLAAGATVRVHTGSGSDSSSDLYWGTSMFRWDNDADTATLRDASGDVAQDTSWSVPDVVIPTINEDGDTLNDEYVDFENRSGGSVDMAGWTVEDEAGYTYTVPDGFSLADGATVRLHSGSGSDSSTDLYWGRGSPVWNNGGDTVTLADDSGAIVQVREYPSPFDFSITEISLDGDTLNDEYVDVTNGGSSIVDLSGFTLEDEAGYTYTFPDSFGLDAGSTVRVHTGEGDDSTTDLYWGRGAGVWNNGGDTAYVYDDNDVLLDSQDSSSSGTDSTISIATINEDGATLNDEYVDFENTGSSAMDLTGWTVEDDASHTYHFPDNFALDAGATVRLHTGDGTDSSTDLYWGSGTYIWNNSGDTCYLYESDGTLHASKSY